MCMSYTTCMAYTALIIGGGIAGTLSEIALRKAGIDAVVFEAYQGTADNVGAFLTLPVNALDVLRTLNVDLGELGFDTSRMTISSGSGRRLGEMPYGTAMPDGTVSRTIKRAALYQALREQATLHGVPIQYG